MGLCQWFHFEDHRLDAAAAWMRKHKVSYLRTGLSWADSYRPNAVAWFDRLMKTLDPFQVTITLCFTPQHLGIEPHHTSPPIDNTTFASFATWAVGRYASASPSSTATITSPVQEAQLA
jgi:beta-xylosidase